MELNTEIARIILPRAKQISLCQKIRRLMKEKTSSICSAMRVLGVMVSSMEAIPFAQFHTRPLQRAILRSWDKTSGSLVRLMTITPNLCKELRWWLVSPAVNLGRSFLPSFWTIITTDASLHGWGGVCSPHTVQGTWSVEEACLPINILELRAIFLSLVHWTQWLKGRPIRVQTDNATAVAYLNHQGGTRSVEVMKEASKILRWAEMHVPALSAIYIPGVENWTADFLSRETVDPGEWSLHPQIFEDLCLCWGRPDVDLMASRYNRKVSTFLSRMQSSHVGGLWTRRSSFIRGRRSCGTLARVSAPLCLSTDSPSVPSSAENQEGGDSGNTDCSRLASSALVRRPHRSSCRCAMATPASQRPVVTGPDLSPAFRAATFDGVAVESAILRARGFEEKVIGTMVGARKPVSAKVYYRVWRSYFLWCEENSFPPLEFSLSRILSFLQRGLDLGLALSSLKGQVSALSILFQMPLASDGSVRTLFQGVVHIAPHYRSPISPWDLNLVLSVLQEVPFEPLRDISLRFLSWKVAFLVAITSLRRVSEIAALSCKSPFLVLHQDKVVLRPPPEFLPKGVSSFHVNEDIVLPSFCPSPSHPKEKALHCLDVVRAIRIYLSVSAVFRRSDSLFVIPEGPRKGQAASKATIARWIRLIIAEAYRVRGKSPPTRLVAHSTRAVGASWAMHHQASALQLCKAATWSSLHTFTKFYRVHTFASADASVGRKILQAAVSETAGI